MHWRDEQEDVGGEAAGAALERLTGETLARLVRAIEDLVEAFGAIDAVAGAPESPERSKATAALWRALAALRAAQRAHDVTERGADDVGAAALALCPRCGRYFLPQRSDAEYCSGACRQAAYRYRARRGRGAP